MADKRRQLKVCRVIKEVVSEAILYNISDPRLTAVVSVTEVEVTPDLREAKIFLSLLADNESSRRKSFAAIKHARGHIQTLLAHELNIRFCPIISFCEDVKTRKTNETLKLIDQVAEEFRENPLIKEDELQE